MEKKREEFRCGKVQPGSPLFDQGIELLGQQPEGMGILQAASFGRIRDAVQMLRWQARHLDARLQSEQVTQQGIQEQVACPVGEGSHPLPDRGSGRSLAMRALSPCRNLCLNLRQPRPARR